MKNRRQLASVPKCRVAALALLATLAVSAAHAQVSPSERAALEAIYSSTDGGNWLDDSGWLGPSGTECTWKGVECMGTSNVVELDLGENNLNGTLPTQIVDLTAIQVFKVNKNFLSGSFPAVPTWTQLRELRIANNQFSGAFPDLSNSADLQVVNINQGNTGTGNNKFTGTLSVFLQFSQLRELNVTENLFSGTIPDLSGLTSLFRLRASRAQLTGQLPPNLASHPSLIDLFLDGNGLTGEIPTLPAGMTVLELAHNGLVSTSASVRSQLDQFDPDWEQTQTVAPTQIMATASSETEAIVSWQPIAHTGGVGEYEVLQATSQGGPTTSAGKTANKSASSLTVTGLAPGATYHFSVRTRTGVSVNQSVALLSASAQAQPLTMPTTPVALSSDFGWSPAMPNIGQTVQFTDESTGGPTSWSWSFGDGTTSTQQNPAKIYQQAGSYSVELTVGNGTGQSSISQTIDVGSTPGQISRVQYDALFALWQETNGSQWTKNRNWAGSRGTECNWSGVQCDASGTKVIAIRLTDSNLTGSLPPSLEDLVHLEVFQINDNPVTGSFPDISRWSALRELRIASCPFDGPFPDISNNTELEVLNANDDKRPNRFTGQLPDMSKLSKLKIFNVSGNLLEGPLPDFSALPSLEQFRAERTRFTGPIPQSVEELSQLNTFFVPGNGLSGEVPDFRSLPRLNSFGLNLHHNALTASDTALFDFVDARHVSRPWSATQTTPPTDVTVQLQQPDRLAIEWTPIAYVQGDGRYVVYHSVEPDDGFTRVGQTASKSASSVVVDVPTSPVHYVYLVTETNANASGKQQGNHVRAVSQPSNLVQIGQGPTMPSTLEFEPATYEVSEKAGSLTLSVRRRGDTSQATSVDFRTRPGSATSEDFKRTVGTLQWGAGDGTSRIITVAINADREIEGTENFTVVLENPSSGATLGNDSMANVFILDVEPEVTVSFESSRYDVIESQTRVAITVTASDPVGQALDLDVNLIDDTAEPNRDFLFATPQLTIPAGQQSVSFEVDILDKDSDFEPPRAFILELVPPSGTQASPFVRTAVVIRDDDSQVEAESTASSQESREPVVAYSRSGRRAIAWSEKLGQRFRVRYTLFNEQGSNEGTFDVPRSSLDQLSPSITWTAGAVERLAVVWREEALGARSSANGRLVGRFFEPGGSTPRESLLGVEATPQGRSPEVASDRNGGVIVTWQDDDDIVGQEIGPYQQGGSRPFIVSPTTASVPRLEVDRAAGGDSVVIWRDGNAGNGAIRLRGFSDGARGTGGFVRTVDDGGVDEPAVALLPDGSFVVVYEKDDQIWGSSFGPSGQERTAPKRLSTTAGQSLSPRVAANSTDFVVTWQESAAGKSANGKSANDGAGVARFFDPFLEPISNEIPIVAAEENGSPAELDVDIDEADTTTLVFTRDDGAGPRVFQSIVRPSLASGGCDERDGAICLADGRFRITAKWKTRQADQGGGNPRAVTTDSGYLTFFDEENVELIVKVLDGCALNGHYWVFAGGLTDQEVTLTVEDTLAGASATYFNPLGSKFQPVQDTKALRSCQGAPDLAGNALTDDIASGLSVCSDDDTLLCLGEGGRFRVGLDWRTQQGDSGLGMPQGLTNDTGYFWFFSPDNIEVVIKVLDGCAVNGHYWVFAGGLTDVEVDLVVDDPVTGARFEAMNPLRRAFAPIVDTSALAACEP